MVAIYIFFTGSSAVCQNDIIAIWMSIYHRIMGVDGVENFLCFYWFLLDFSPLCIVEE